MEHVHDHRRVVDGREEEGFDAEDVVGEGPWSHRLANDGYLVAELLLEDADRFDDRPVVSVLEEAARHLDVVDGLPDGFCHPDGWPVVFAFPLHLASEGGGLLDDGEVGHYGVEAELGVTGGC